jgi:hypothetical protein
MTPTTAKEAWARMTPEERLAMAKECPAVLMSWADNRALSGSYERCDRNAPILWTAAVAPDTEHIKARWIIKLRNGDTIQGAEETTAEAMSACDAELIRQGYVLETSE